MIVPVYNDLAGLSRCVEHLERQTRPAEIIVVDNGSDESERVDAADFPTVRVVFEGREGSYAARNAGIRAATGRVIAFTDADCLPAPGWLEAGTAALDRDAADLVGGAITVFPEEASHPRAAELYEMKHAFPQQTYVQELGFAATANLLVRRSVFEAVGPFREDLRSGGDLEFGRRATSAGFRIVFEPEAVVAHPARSTFAELSGKLDRTAAGLRDLDALGQGVDAAMFDHPWRRLVPPFRSVVRGLGDPSITGVPSKVRYAWAVVVVHYLRAAALRRAGRGTASPRA